MDDAIVPDAKDWTWVLQRPCAECGFDTRTIRGTDVAPLIRETAARWSEILRSSSAVSRRPASNVWSPLEYGCHVRDVFRLYDQRLQLMLSQDDPLFQNWDQDVTAVEDRYGEQDPHQVAGDLQAAAGDLAARFETVSGSQWERPGRRSDGASFTVETFARYFIHDPIHHLYDVTGRQYPAG
jgi:hypothetical protein